MKKKTAVKTTRKTIARNKILFARVSRSNLAYLRRQCRATGVSIAVVTDKLISKARATEKRV